MTMAFKEISVGELHALGEATIIDVREVDEYVAGHVPGAVNIPLSSITERVSEFAVASTVHVICQSGGRSARACEFLANQAGLQSVQFVNILGGTGGWILEGHEVVLGPEPK